ncbi:OmpA family protein [Porticoccaceae bacterium]|nr:OmpA family protein [Porticoccaceae bacterium]
MRDKHPGILMKFFYSALLFVFLYTIAPALSAGQWYIGATQAIYDLGEDSEWNGNIQVGQVGLQLGNNLNDRFSIEAGYGVNFNREDIRMATLSGLFWLGDSTDKYRTYVLLGGNSYSFNNKDLTDKEQSTQFVVGGGFATGLLGGLELRADLRTMTKEDDNKGDFGVQISLNHRFQSSSNDSVYVTKLAEIRQKIAASNPVAINLSVKFGFDSSEVVALYSEQLEVIAKGMRQQDDIQLVLKGYSDSIGTVGYNYALSKARAEAVRRMLADDYGIALERISVVSYGEKDPVASNMYNKGRALNRRVIGELNFTEVDNK